MQIYFVPGMPVKSSPAILSRHHFFKKAYLKKNLSFHTEYQGKQTKKNGK